MRALVVYTFGTVCTLGSIWACSSEDDPERTPFIPASGGGNAADPGSSIAGAGPDVPPAGPVPVTPGSAGTPAATPGEVAVTPEGPLDGTMETGGSAASPDAGTGTPIVPEPPLDTRSAGCGKANPPVGAGSLTIRGAQADYIVTLPAGYSPDTPAPLVFGFHGRNRTHAEFQTVDASGIQTELGSSYVMVYPKSQGGPGWNFDNEIPPSIEFFDALYTQTLDNYCIDTSRVFAVGHSSGGYFSIILACRYGALLRGIGSIAGAETPSEVCTSERVAGMFIHGAADTVVANAGGRAARDELLARNACTQSTVPGPVSPCVAYQGCAEGFPVEWCEHTEPEYFDNGVATNHGWPSFASRAVRGFFEALPR